MRIPSTMKLIVFETLVCALCVVHLVEVAHGKSAAWWGRTCCELSLSSRCRNRCQRAKVRSDLSDACKPGEEFSMFACLERQEAGFNCCHPTTTRECYSACRLIFIHDTLPPARKQQRVGEVCESEVASCVLNYTRTSPARSQLEYLSCCDHGISETCQAGCRDAVYMTMSVEDAENEVIRHCGDPDPMVAMWQCFLHVAARCIRDRSPHTANIEVTSVDGPKLMCCVKAVTNRCKDLCIQTYGKRSTESFSKFHTQCNYDTANERDLNTCLEEVTDQCQPGCSGLAYCTNFNNRPTQLFRTCSAQADSEARVTMRMWEKGVISKPMLVDFDIPIKNIQRCEPAKWKALACALHIKPCHNMAHATWICRSDCMDILSVCLDTTRLPVGVTVQEICVKLSPQDETLPCISLSTYLGETGLRGSEVEVTTPCVPNPCNSSQVCVVNRHTCSPAAKHCHQFICKSGCAVGALMSMVVPHGAYVKIPMSSNLNCHHVCKCGAHAALNGCREIGCIQEHQCFLSSGMIHSHNARFHLGCNSCACFSSKVVCTNRSCGAISRSTNNSSKSQFAGLPYGCDGTYKPVCGRNGRTFPNVCLASHSGVPESHVSSGSCSTLVPCSRHSCSTNEVCVARRQVCLNPMTDERECQQYECVNLSQGSDSEGPVCDVTGKEFHNVGALLAAERQLAYRGPCRSDCQSQGGSVCGTDGNTYTSECSAWAAGVLADYDGPCRTFSHPSAYDRGANTAHCRNVTCSTDRLPTSGCQLVVPPGACCGVCAGELRLLASPRLVRDAAKAMPRDVLTVEDVVDTLRLHVRVRECELFG